MEYGKGRVWQRPFQSFTQIVKGVLWTGAIFVLVLMLSHFRLSYYFPIKTVRIYGVQHLNPQEIQQLLFPLVNHGFFNIRIESIKDRLLQMPWVSQIFVRRTWPDQVAITIVEKQAIAIWNEQRLLSTEGQLFAPKANTYPADLPLFKGPEGKHVLMLKYFTRINRLLLPLHVKISSLELTPYMSWKLMLDNHLTLQIGHTDILTRLNHFVKVYPKIIGTRSADVDYVDLRYPQGMAVQWKAVVKT